MIRTRPGIDGFPASTAPVRRHAGPSVASLDAALAFGWTILRRVEALALQLAAAYDIELPESAVSAEDSAALQIAAALYLASELEAARLLQTVETLAGLAVSGGLCGDFGRGAEKLYRFFQGRESRFNANERAAFFARLFGSQTAARLALPNSINSAFEPLMIELTDALYNFAVDRTQRGRGADVTLRLAARRLADNLLPRSEGLAGYAAQDIIRASNEALNILKEPGVQRAVGARSVWMTIRGAAARYLGEDVDVASHVERGRAGVIILSWLADRYPLLDDHNSPLLGEDDPVINAAADWLQASLDLEEQQAALAGETTR